MSLLLNLILPSLGSKIPKMMSISVDLPDPDEPIIPRLSPFLRSRLKFSRQVFLFLHIQMKYFQVLFP